MDVWCKTRAYYDAFASHYESRRDGRGRYHDLLDDLETSLAVRYAAGRDVLEVGCGTGLILRRLAPVARRAVGADLSPGMLEHARARGLEVVEARLEALPFEDASFDLVVAFKTLAHVPSLSAAVAELVRVTRPGGVLILELYNPWSLRGVMKRLLPPARVGTFAERDIVVRYDDRDALERALPPGTRIEGRRGIRTVVPTASVLEIPVVGPCLDRVERGLCDTVVAGQFGGFVCWVVRKQVPAESADVSSDRWR